MNSLDSALLQLVRARYEKVVEVNLTEQTLSVLWPSSDTLSQLSDLFDNAKLYPRDIKSLRRFKSSEIMKCALKDKQSLSFRIRRRKPRGRYEWIQVEVVKSSEYSEENIDLLVFIKNIEDIYAKEYNARKHAERLAKTDSLTGYQNKFAFDRFKVSHRYASVGVAFVDLNQLKVVNDSQGHSAGDAYIKSCCDLIDKTFTRSSKFRVGGDEFIIITPDISLSKFQLRINQFNDSIQQDPTSMPICSIGYQWTDNVSQPIEDIVRRAEMAMYAQKEANYLKYHEDRRNHRDRRTGTDRRASNF